MKRAFQWIWVFLFVFSFQFSVFSFPKIPNGDRTPGSICTTEHDDFKEFRYREKIPYCARGVSSSLKKRIYRQYKIPLECKSLYTIDHLIPLSIGGDNSKENLWPEHKKIKKLRQNLEFRAYLDLKKGKITQEEAIERVLHAKFNPPVDDLNPGDPCARHLFVSFRQ